MHFKRVGAPQPHEVANASARDAVKSMEAVHEESISVFQVGYSAVLSLQKHVFYASHAQAPLRSDSIASEDAKIAQFSCA